MRIFRIPFPRNTSGGLLLKLCFFQKLDRRLKQWLEVNSCLSKSFYAKNCKKKKEKEREAHSEPSPLFSPKILPYNAFLGYKLQNSSRNNTVCLEQHLESSKTYKAEFFAKIVHCWKRFTVFGKSSTLDIWLGSEYTSLVLNLKRHPQADLGLLQHPRWSALW